MDRPERTWQDERRARRDRRRAERAEQKQEDEELRRWWREEAELDRREQEHVAATAPVVAGLFARWLAFVLDVCLYVFIGGAPLALLPLGKNPPLGILALMWASGVALLYVPATVRWWGTTPGKLVLRLRVVRTDDYSVVSPGHALGRFLVHALLIFLPLGFFVDHLWAFGAQSRALHDVWLGTSVVPLSALDDRATQPSDDQNNSTTTWGPGHPPPQ